MIARNADGPDPVLAEERLLGALLWYRDLEDLREVQELLEPAAFTTPHTRAVFGAMKTILGRGDLVDVDLLATELQRVERLEDAGGIEYLSALSMAAEPAPQPAALARVVRDQSLRRRLLEEVQHAVTSTDSVEELADVVGAAVERLPRSTTGGVEVLSLAEILADPAALQPPESVVEHLAWRGRVTLLAAREKLGKSTYATAAVAALTAGHRFAGTVNPDGSALYVGLEEHRADLAARLTEFGADPEKVFILDRLAHPFRDVEAATREVGPDLVVVDTLAALTESLDLDPGSSTAWTPIMSRLTRIARDTGAALVLLHHGRKGDGSYRDSTAIGAGVDAILEMREGEAPGVRKLKARGRWKLSGYSVRLAQSAEGLPPYFELTADSLSIDVRVRLFLERNAGASKRAVRDAVRGRASDIDSAIFSLLKSGAIEDRGTGSRSAFHPVSLGRPQEHATDTDRTRDGHGVSGDRGSGVSSEGAATVGGPLGTRPQDAAT